MYSGILWNSLAYVRNTNTFTIENLPCCCYKCVIQYFLNTKCGRIFCGSIKYKCGSLICIEFASPQYFPSSSLPLTAKYNNP